MPSSAACPERLPLANRPVTFFYIGLGSNQGDRLSNLRQAVALLNVRFGEGRASSLYETDPIGYLDQPSFLNAVWEGETGQSPQQIHLALKAVESVLGRTPTFPNGPREIDLDLLLCGDRVLATQELTVPHARMTERAFVLVPLCEIAPGAEHPVANKHAQALLDGLGPVSGVRKVSGDSWWKGSETSGGG